MKARLIFSMIFMTVCASLSAQIVITQADKDKAAEIVSQMTLEEKDILMASILLLSQDSIFQLSPCVTDLRACVIFRRSSFAARTSHAGFLSLLHGIEMQRVGLVTESELMPLQEVPVSCCVRE